MTTNSRPPGLWRLAVLALLASDHHTWAFTVRFSSLKSLLWPGSQAFEEPLPPGSLGCPLFGSNILAGSNEKGPETFYRAASARLDHLAVWKFYFMGSPAASISGAALVKVVLSEEFSYFGPSSEAYNKSTKGKKQRVAIFGSNNVMFERDKKCIASCDVLLDLE